MGGLKGKIRLCYDFRCTIVDCSSLQTLFIISWLQSHLHYHYFIAELAMELYLMRVQTIVSIPCTTWCKVMHQESVKIKCRPTLPARDSIHSHCGFERLDDTRNIQKQAVRFIITNITAIKQEPSQKLCTCSCIE